MSSVSSVPTSGYRSGFDADGSAEASPSRRARGRRNPAVHTPLILATVAIVALSCHLRWYLASTTSWQCDEIPLLVRFTGLCGHVTNDQEAREFKPGYYTFYMGALRSLRAPRFIAAIHTTTGFWVNLSIHLFGVTPAAGRLIPFIWSIAAIAAAVWGTWLVARSIPAACIAAFLVALSPHAVAYAAQARGYAEAMALAPVLLITLEYYRRRPDGWFRATAVMICAIQLSLTVFTMWIYWVAPTLLLAIFVLPRLGKSRIQSRTGYTRLLIRARSPSRLPGN